MGAFGREGVKYFAYLFWCIVALIDGVLILADDKHRSLIDRMFDTAVIPARRQPDYDV